MEFKSTHMAFFLILSCDIIPFLSSYSSFALATIPVTPKILKSKFISACERCVYVSVCISKWSLRQGRVSCLCKPTACLLPALFIFESCYKEVLMLMQSVCSLLSARSSSHKEEAGMRFAISLIQQNYVYEISF